MGGILLALIEGASIAVSKFASPPQNMPIMIDDQMPNMAGGVPGFSMGQMGGPGHPGESASLGSGSSSAPTDSGSSSSWFGGGWFGGKEKKQDSGGSKAEVLESFDAPAPPTFEFK